MDVLTRIVSVIQFGCYVLMCVALFNIMGNWQALFIVAGATLVVMMIVERAIDNETEEADVGEDVE